MAQFDEAKVGQKVWNLQRGWGFIKKLENSTYPVTIEYEHKKGIFDSFSWEGKEKITDLNPTLFWSEVSIDLPERPKEECLCCGYLKTLEHINLDPWLLDAILFLLSQHHSCEKRIK